MTATTRTTSTSRTDQPIHQLVIRAKRAVFPDGIRPAVVVVDDERITALLEDGAAVEAREEIVVQVDFCKFLSPFSWFIGAGLGFLIHLAMSRNDPYIVKALEQAATVDLDADRDSVAR